MYPCKFRADENPETKTGTASFWVDGKNFVVILESFADCQTISEMLEVAERQGRNFAASQMFDFIVTHAKEKYLQLTIT